MWELRDEIRATRILILRLHQEGKQERQHKGCQASPSGDVGPLHGQLTLHGHLLWALPFLSVSVLLLGISVSAPANQPPHLLAC